VWINNQWCEVDTLELHKKRALMALSWILLAYTPARFRTQPP